MRDDGDDLTSTATAAADSKAHAMPSSKCPFVPFRGSMEETSPDVFQVGSQKAASSAPMQAGFHWDLQNPPVAPPSMPLHPR